MNQHQPKKMTTQEIVQKSDFAKNHGMKWEELYAAMHKTIEDGDFRVMRSGNVLFWYEIEPDGAAQFWTINGGHGKDLPEAYADFYNAMGVSKFKKLTSKTTNPAEIKAMHYAGLPIQVNVLQMDRQGGHLFQVDVTIQ